MSSDPTRRPPRWERAVATAVSLWRRLRQAAAVVIAVWQRLGTLDKARTVILLLAAIWLLGVMPWHESRFDVRRFIIGILIIVGVAAFSIVYLSPKTARKYSGEISFGAAIIAFLLVPESTSSKEFYSAAAQVVPVLFLTLAFEQRAFQVRSDMDQSDRHFVAFPAFALLLAGVESFRGLLDKPQAVSLQLVASGLVFASVALFIRAVTGRRNR
jgi:hypothetical protein